MATTVGQHSVASFTSPVNGTTPIDANTVRGNDNTIRVAYVDHDADPGIHVQSSTLASRPTAGTAGRKWITTDTGQQKLWYDDGTDWHEVGGDAITLYCKATESIAKGDIVKVTGYNVGQAVAEIAKVASASDVAFGIANQAIANGSLGYVINTGTIQDVNTNSFSIGNVLYPNTSGGLTATKPTSGTYQPVAYVLRANATNGVLYVEFSAPRIVESSSNTASTVVQRDASGNFSAGTITAGALTSTGLVTFASLKGTGATTVTDILNDSTMATASATTLATSSSIKTYVDTKVATVDTLAEVLANGNTTGATDIIVNAGQKIRTPLVAAQDGTSAITIANTTGALTLNTALADSNLATISTAGKVANSATTAASANTASAIVARDASGNFTAGTITAALTGNASTATKLATARNINGVAFDGTADITVTAAAGTLSGNTLASGVTASSLTSVGTLTSLTVSGDLTVDTNTFKVDSTNNRVGVGTATPAQLFTVSATTDARIRINAASTALSGGTELGGIEWQTNDASSSGTGIGASITSQASGNFGSDQQGVRLIFSTRDNGAGQTNTERMRIESAGNVYVGIDGTAAAPVISRLSDQNTGLFFAAADTLAVTTGGTERLRVDASGNLGLGVTPSAWYSTTTSTFQVRRTSLSAILENDLHLTSNAFFDGTNWKYIASSVAVSNYFQNAGSHAWRTAAAGTAGNNVSFTQAMTLDASSNLTLKGNYIIDDTGQGIVSANGTGSSALTLNGRSYLTFTTGGTPTGGTERARITSGGDFLIGATSGTHRLTVNVPSGADREMLICGVTGASNGFRIQWNHATLKTHVSITDIPTSSAGLPAGTLYSDGGTIKIA